MKFLLTAYLMIVSSSFSHAQTTIAVETAKVSFVIKNAGINVNGSIAGFEAQISFDPQNPAGSRIQGSVDPNTISTGIGLRDKHLKKSDYFDVKQYPKISMVSNHIQKSGSGKYTGTFNLTIKSTTKRINIPFSFSQTENNCFFKGEFSIDRLHFNVGEESIILANWLKVKIEITGNIQ